MTNLLVPRLMRLSFYRAVVNMYEYCRKAEYPCGRLYSARAGVRWAWKLWA